ncbi:hypothetical protein IWX78_001816 [Mycetocola sp. CAN_C7]
MVCPPCLEVVLWADPLRYLRRTRRIGAVAYCRIVAHNRAPRSDGRNAPTHRGHPRYRDLSVGVRGGLPCCRHRRVLPSDSERNHRRRRCGDRSDSRNPPPAAHCACCRCRCRLGRQHRLPHRSGHRCRPLPLDEASTNDTRFRQGFEGNPAATSRAHPHREIHPGRTDRRQHDRGRHSLPPSPILATHLARRSVVGRILRGDRSTRRPLGL